MRFIHDIVVSNFHQTKLGVNIASSIFISLAKYGHLISIMPVSESEQTFPSGVAPKKQKLGFTTNPQSCKCLLVNLSVYFSFVFTSFAIPYDVAADVNCFGSNMDFRNFHLHPFFFSQLLQNLML
jgi:hypothetical protein